MRFFQKFRFIKYVTAAGKQTSLSSGTRIQQWLLRPISGKLSQPVSNLTFLTKFYWDGYSAKFPFPVCSTSSEAA
jgi:hypothetical protein